MCKFCEEDFKIETNIGDKELEIFLDSEDKRILTVRLPFAKNGGGITKPIIIEYCPFCNNDLKKLNCEECFNYNIGDGIDDIRECESCRYNCKKYIK